MKSVEVKRGDIWFVELERMQGDVIYGMRPAVVVSNDRTNRHAEIVTVIPLTSAKKHPLPCHVAVAGYGLERESVALTEQIVTISKECRAGGSGRLPGRGDARDRARAEAADGCCIGTASGRRVLTKRGGLTMVKTAAANYAIVQQGDGESMTHQEILEHVDHTLLAAYATWEDIEKLCKEGVEYHTASVCIPPNYVRRVKERFGETIPVCTVVASRSDTA